MLEPTGSRSRAPTEDCGASFWIFIHEVEYIDFEKDRMINGHSLAPIFYKRKEFADERELRAVVDVFPVGDARRLGTKPLPTGNAMEVDFRRLLTRVILSPFPAPDLLKRVEQLIDSAGIPLAYSSLDKAPRR